MSNYINAIINLMISFRLWHKILDMDLNNRAWHEQDVADEFIELQEAETILFKWSEMSDVVYTVTRARSGGHDLLFPISKTKVIIGAIYMFPKYTSRWLFFNRAGKKAGAIRKVTEVRNPSKIHKLHFIAEKYEVDKEKFVEICNHQLRYWPLLK